MAEVGWLLKENGDFAWLSFEGWDGVRCLHSTRLGGVSSPPFNTLNLSDSVGDFEENVQKNRKRFQGQTGLDLSKLTLARQVHSDRVNIVRQDSQDNRYEGDALLTRQKGIPLGVSVADCLPIFIHDRAGGAVGLVHAGWKGTLKEIARKAVSKMGEVFGTRPGDCSVLFGPAIGPCCYEVNAEIAGQFQNQFPGSTANRTLDPPEADQGNSKHEHLPLGRYISKIFLDLRKANELQLRDIGVKRISNSRLCTSCGQELFFSHRRDGGRTGRTLAIVESSAGRDAPPTGTVHCGRGIARRLGILPSEAHSSFQKRRGS